MNQSVTAVVPAESTVALWPLPAGDCRVLCSDKSLPQLALCSQTESLLLEQSTHYLLIPWIGEPVCIDTHKPSHMCANTFSEHAGLCFLLSTDVIVFLMVLEVITPCNVTRSLVLSSKPQHGSAEVPYTHHHSPLNDSISQKASAIASSCARIWGMLHQQPNWLYTRGSWSMGVNTQTND